MRLILPAAAAALVIGTAPLLAEHDTPAPDDSFYSAKDTPGPHGSGPGLYERIAAHYGAVGRNVKERFRDGPCKVKREWKTNGDYEESIKCRGPRRSR